MPRRTIPAAAALAVASVLACGHGAPPPAGTEPTEASGTETLDLPEARPVIGAMYHHWYGPGRWSQRGPYMPLLGEYDSADPAVATQHVAWAQSAGLNTFVLDTWITPGAQEWMERNTPPTLDVFDATGMQYFFIADGWFEHSGSDPGGYDAHGIASAVVSTLAGHFARPGYLRVDDKPVIFFWATDPTDCELWRRVRADLEGTLGPVYMTGFSDRDSSCWDRLMYYNAYNPTYSDAAGQLAAADRLWQNFSGRGLPWAPTAFPGYDDTHIRTGNPPFALDPELLRQSLRTALRFDQGDETPWLFVCSFSEWNEASVIEPSEDFDDPEVFLKVLHDELDAAGWLEGSGDSPGVEPPDPPPVTPSGNAACNAHKAARAYRGILGRQADCGGLSNHAALLDAGQPTITVTTGLFASAEFSATRSSLDAEALARELYVGILEREPEPAGLASTAAAIEAGQRAAVAAGMLDSTEFLGRYCPDLVGGGATLAAPGCSN